MNLLIELDREEDGRWIGEVVDLSGVMTYGDTREQAIARVQALALRVIADRLEQGADDPALAQVFSVST
jgi:predicted RNase H-like HicB family nuclease